MKERIYKGITGQSLQVYPHLPDDASDAAMASAGYVEAINYWKDDGSQVWGVRINVGYSMPVSRETSDALIAAINRCWQWVDESEA